MRAETKIWFRVTGNMGIPYEALNKIIKLTKPSYTDDAKALIYSKQGQLDELVEKRDKLKDFKEQREALLKEIDNLKLELRPFGDGTEFYLETSDYKPGWYCIQHPSMELSDKEVDYLVSKIKDICKHMKLEIVRANNLTYSM